MMVGPSKLFSSVMQQLEGDNRKLRNTIQTLSSRIRKYVTK